MNIKCLNNISDNGMKAIREVGNIVDNVNEAESIVVRSFDMHEYELNDNIIAVARAGAGVNNIPIDKYGKQGVVVFNTPGANSNAVKEMVLCGALLACRDVCGGINWVKDNAETEELNKVVEKKKATFAGFELMGKKIFVWGLGVIGYKVANMFSALGMKVYGYDPFIREDIKKEINTDVTIVDDYKKIIKEVDFITVHIPLNDNTKGIINKEIFDVLEKKVVLLNFSRDKIVNEDDLKEAIDCGKVVKYVTDFPNNKVVKYNNVIAIPHLGASTEEAEDMCAIMAAKQIAEYKNFGSIVNSVNYPYCKLDKKGKKYRILLNAVSEEGIDINNIIEDTNNIDVKVFERGAYKYIVIDSDELINIEKADYIKKIRVI